MQVHFRAYPTEVLTLCEVEAVKWNFVNALKEVQVNSAFDVLIQLLTCQANRVTDTQLYAEMFQGVSVDCE